MTMAKNFYTVKDLAEQWQVEEKSVRRLANKGKLKGKKICNKWIFTSDQVKELFEENKA